MGELKLPLFVGLIIILIGIISDAIDPQKPLQVAQDDKKAEIALLVPESGSFDKDQWQSAIFTGKYGCLTMPSEIRESFNSWVGTTFFGADFYDGRSPDLVYPPYANTLCPTAMVWQDSLLEPGRYLVQADLMVQCPVNLVCTPVHDLRLPAVVSQYEDLIQQYHQKNPLTAIINVYQDLVLGTITSLGTPLTREMADNIASNLDMRSMTWLNIYSTDLSVPSQTVPIMTFTCNRGENMLQYATCVTINIVTTPVDQY